MIRQEFEQMFDYLLSKHHGHTVTVLVGRSNEKIHNGYMTYNPQLCKITVDVMKYKTAKKCILFTMSFTLGMVVEIGVDSGDYLKIRIN